LDARTLSQRSPLRRALWYLKLVFACYAVSFATFMLAGVVALPFSGYTVIDWWFQDSGRIAMLVLAVVVSPLVYRHLK
jgi:hypothetical protein